MVQDNVVTRHQLALIGFWVVIVVVVSMANQENARDILVFGLSLAVGAGVHAAAEEFTALIDWDEKKAAARRLHHLLPVMLGFTAMLSCQFLLSIRFDDSGITAAFGHAMEEAAKPVIAIHFIRRLTLV